MGDTGLRYAALQARYIDARFYRRLQFSHDAWAKQSRLGSATSVGETPSNGLSTSTKKLKEHRIKFIVVLRARAQHDLHPGASAEVLPIVMKKFSGMDSESISQALNLSSKA